MINAMCSTTVEDRHSSHVEKVYRIGLSILYNAKEGKCVLTVEGDRWVTSAKSLSAIRSLLTRRGFYELFESLRILSNRTLFTDHAER